MASTDDIVTRVGERTLTLTNLDKVLYPSVGFTKAEVIDYYLRIAPVMLPYIRDRVMTRLRFPDGVGPDRSPFYEKNAPMGTPEWVRRVKVNTRMESSTTSSPMMRRLSSGWLISLRSRCTFRSGR
jgi:bifunctional non-homologous end joining protein LigD